MPESVETEKIHFLDGLFGGPFFHGHAIRGDENACAIVTETAVHEEFFSRIVAEKKKKLGDLFVAWGRPAIDGDVDKAHAERFNVLAFPGDCLAVLLAQIDYGGDAQDFQLREAHFPGLRAAVEDLCDFSGVRNSINMQFLSVRGLRERWCGRSGVGLRRKQDGHEKKSEYDRQAFHNGLDASSVAREVLQAKALKHKRLTGKSTTTNRRSTKTSTTFCVFLLTENFLPLILRFQIRGTWKRQTDRVGDVRRSV